VEVAPATVLAAAPAAPTPAASAGGGVGAWWFLAVAALAFGAWATGATRARRRTGLS
jgi:hypothetical protein